VNTISTKDGWHSVTIVGDPPMPTCAIAPSQQVYIDLCRSISKLALLTADDCSRGSLVAADHGRHLLFQMIQRLGPAMLEVVEEFGGPTEACPQCGDIVALCRCEDVEF